MGRQITIPAGDVQAKRALNFSGEQRSKVMAATNSPNRASNGGGGWKGQLWNGGLEA